MADLGEGEGLGTEAATVPNIELFFYLKLLRYQLSVVT